MGEKGRKMVVGSGENDERKEVNVVRLDGVVVVGNKEGNCGGREN